MVVLNHFPHINECVCYMFCFITMALLLYFLFSVDTLLQVHALHNLIDVLPFTSENADELISVHRPVLDQLETKYMANCSLLVS